MKNLATMLKPLVLSVTLLALFTMFAAVQTVKADPLVAGQTIPGPSTIVLPVGLNVIANSSTTFSNPTLSGTARTAVVRLANNSLVFYYQFSSTGGTVQADDVNRIAAFNFDAFTTDVFQATNGSVLGNGFLNGTVPSITADRSAAGGTIGFNFAPGTFNVGTSSLTFAIRTNATQFTAGNFSIQDGVNQNVSAFQPTTVPEPATMLLLGTGLAGVASAVRKRRKAL